MHGPDPFQDLFLPRRVMVLEPVLEERRDLERQTDDRMACPPRPESAAALRIAGISCSVSPGISGATITPTGTPALARAAIALSRPAGRVVRGSRRPTRSSSSDVIETNTPAAL